VGKDEFVTRPSRRAYFIRTGRPLVPPTLRSLVKKKKIAYYLKNFKGGLYFFPGIFHLSKSSLSAGSKSVKKSIKIFPFGGSKTIGGSAEPISKFNY